MKDAVFILAVFAGLVHRLASIHIESEWKIYYNMTTNETIDVIGTSNPRLKYYLETMKNEPKNPRIGFGPIPCSCQDLTCGCCAGMNIAYFNFNQRGCMNFTYDPREFSLTMDMFMNDESLYKQSISGKNPPPVCMPIPIPYLPSIDMCVKFFNIHTPGYNVFMCVDFETRMERAPVLVLHFDCMQMGMDGISYHKPEEDGPEIEDTDDTGDQGIQNEEEVEIYDEVFEDDGTTSPPPVKSCGDRAKEEVYDEVFEEGEDERNGTFVEDDKCEEVATGGTPRRSETETSH